MAEILNQFSYPMLAVFLLAILAVAVLRPSARPNRRRNLAILGAVFIFIALFWVFTRPVASDTSNFSFPSPGSPSDSPVLVEYQSPF